MNKEQRIKELELKQLELQREIEALKKESELPSEWNEELELKRYYGKNVEVSIEYIKPFEALSKLIILRDIYRESEDEQVDWSEGSQKKYNIITYNGIIDKDLNFNSNRILSFTKE